ncbi:MAG: lysophospholipid acyltransferase family protein [bacterium]
MSSMRRRLDALLFAVSLPFLWLLSVCPSPRLCRIGRWIGAAAYHLDRRHRQICLENLAIAFPQWPLEQRRAVARRCFQNVATTFLEIPGLGRLPFDQLVARVGSVTGREHYERALTRNKGVLILTGHFGNWELMALCTGIAGYRLAFVARALDNPYFDQWLNRIRHRSGNRIIPKRGALRQILRSLRQGYGVGLLMDQRVTGNEGVFVDFFGHQAGSSAALALLACRSGAPVLPVYMLRDPSGVGHQLHIEPEVPVVRTGRNDLDILENTQRLQKVLERVVREHPDQWFWMHRRWKGSPTVSYSGAASRKKKKKSKQPQPGPIRPGLGARP